MRFLGLTLSVAVLLPTPLLYARAQAVASVPSPQDYTASTLRTGTQLVILDVVVQDKQGNPVRGLSRDDFTLLEKKQPQKLLNFEEHSSLIKPKAGPQLPPMPPGVFTDYTSTPPNGSLNILLLDSLNTPTQDQAYVQYELQQYVKKAQPGTRIAIFGLSRQLYMLQGFTSETSTLKDAVEHKLIPRASVLLDDAVGGGNGTDGMAMSDTASDLRMTQVSSNLQQFEAERESFQTQLRIQYTIDAFNTLAHYLAAFPGRKNLIWFSGSFPIDIQPDGDLNNAFSIMENNDELFRETTNLLARAQVAVYPVDARGLMTDPTLSAANSGHGFARNPSSISKESAKFFQDQANEHLTMAQLASDTGGQASYNNNDLAGAVSKAIDAGSNYYTLTYIPTDHDWNGEYRAICVNLATNLNATNYVLSYRHGYYADSPLALKAKNNQVAAAVTPDSQQSTAHGYSYVQAAMAHGAPLPEEILFKVRVLPDSAVPEDNLAPANHVDPAHPIKPPFRRYDIDIALLPDGFSLKQRPDGRWADGIDFEAFFYDNDGKLLNATGRNVTLDLKPDAYKVFLHGSIKGHLEISAPAKAETFLRIGIHDVNSDHMGVVEVPISRVSNLPPIPEAQSATAPGQSAASPTAATTK